MAVAFGSGKTKGGVTGDYEATATPHKKILTRGLSTIWPPPHTPLQNISEDGAKNALEFVRGVEIHPSSFYLTN